MVEQPAVNRCMVVQIHPDPKKERSCFMDISPFFRKNGIGTSLQGMKESDELQKIQEKTRF